MSKRSKSLVPTYRLHKQSSQAVVTLTDGLGGRRDVLLGPHGSAESRAEYVRVLGEWEAAGRTIRKIDTGRSPDLTVNELLVRYWRYAEQHYRDRDGEPTTELDDMRKSLRPLREVYGHTYAKDFGPLALKAVRIKMIGAGLSRGVINQRIGRVKRCFKWAVGEELVPLSVFHGLQAVGGLQRGRSPAPDHAPILPVDDSLVEAVLPFVLPPVRAMIELQRLTGMRPGEVCMMRACDIDTGGAVWHYRPSRHKTQHRGKVRVVALGPKAQAIIKPFVTLKIEDFLFSPARALAERRAAMRLARKTRVQPSQRTRRKSKPKRPPSGRYNTTAYGKAIIAACKRANVTPWHANQLRHAHATDVRKRFGLEAAQVLLGHSKADVTQVYAERDLGLAEKIAAEVG